MAIKIIGYDSDSCGYEWENRRRNFLPQSKLIDYANRKTLVSPEDRTYIYDRDGRKCLKCSATNWLTIDHVVPLSLGGKNDIGNYQTLCKQCNSEKAARIVNYRKNK